MSYEDTILIKLRRDYAKDEVVMYALNQLQEKKVEIGKLFSYIQELEDNPINQDNVKKIEKLKADLLKSQEKFNKSEKVRTNTKEKRDFEKLKSDYKDLKKEFAKVKERNDHMNRKLYALLKNPQNFNEKTLEEKMDFLSCFDLPENDKI